MPALPALLVANPQAGLGRTRGLAEVLARSLQARGLEVQVLLTRAPDQAASAVDAAIAAGRRRVIVAGGDGTVNSVLGALVHSPAVLGVIPTGMANALARELGIPLGLRAACDIAAGPHLRRLDVGRAGDRHFALMAGVGLDAEVVRSVDPGLKRWLGPGAYIAAGLTCAARASAAALRLHHDGGTLDCRGVMAVVANTAHYTYEWRLAPMARPDDGALDVVVFSRGAPALPGHVVSALVGRHAGQPGVVTMRTRRVRIESDPPLAVQCDGDEAGVTPLEAEVVPMALVVAAPAPGQSHRGDGPAPPP